MYEAAGTIKLINDTQTFPSGFSKREFVVTTPHDKYPQDLKFEVVKDKCSLLDDYSEGQEVNVNFDIRGNEYNGKYYVNLSCWKLESKGGGGSSSGGNSGGGEQAAPAQRAASSAPAPTNAAEPSAADLRNDSDFDDDDIPF